MGFPVSVQPTLPFGAKITATFEEGGAVDEYGQDDDMDYTDVGLGTQVMKILVIIKMI